MPWKDHILIQSIEALADNQVSVLNIARQWSWQGQELAGDRGFSITGLASRI